MRARAAAWSGPARVRAPGSGRAAGEARRRHRLATGASQAVRSGRRLGQALLRRQGLQRWRARRGGAFRYRFLPRLGDLRRFRLRFCCGCGKGVRQRARPAFPALATSPFAGAAARDAAAIVAGAGSGAFSASKIARLPSSPTITTAATAMRLRRRRLSAVSAVESVSGLGVSFIAILALFVPLKFGCPARQRRHQFRFPDGDAAMAGDAVGRHPLPRQHPWPRCTAATRSRSP
jgi:hypothetical protein